jgi:hypothetical protein
MPYPVAACRDRASKVVAPSTLLSGLTGYWPMNEVSGDALETVGGLTFTENGSPGSAAGKVYALARTVAKASSQFFNRDVCAILRGGADFTFATWFNLASHSGASPNYYMLSDCIGFNTGWAMGLTNNGADQVFMQAANAGGYFTAHTLGWAATLNTWYLATCWNDHANKTIYIQRDAQAPVAQVGAAPMDARITYLEKHSFGADAPYSGAPTLYLDGLIGPAMLWNRILTAPERASLWNGGAGRAYPF